LAVISVIGALMVALVVYMVFSRKHAATGWVAGLGPILYIALAIGVLYLYVTASGGVSWSNRSADAYMIQQLEKEYPSSTFRVSAHAFWQPKVDSYELGVVFTSDPATEFTFVLLPLHGYRMLWFQAPTSSNATVIVISEGPAPGTNAAGWYANHPSPSFKPLT